MNSLCIEVSTVVIPTISAIAALVAAVAAYQTAQETKKLVENQIAPLVNIYIAEREDNPSIAMWVIENSGLSTAKNVKFEFEGKPFGILNDNGHSDIPEKHPFKAGIYTLPPKCKYTYNIGEWSKLESNKFTVKWTYMGDQEKSYCSEFTWEDFQSSRMAVHTPPLTRIANSLEQLTEKVFAK